MAGGLQSKVKISKYSNNIASTLKVSGINVRIYDASTGKYLNSQHLKYVNKQHLGDTNYECNNHNTLMIVKNPKNNLIRFDKPQNDLINSYAMLQEEHMVLEKRRK